jgi:geranylgeranyl pyrophosphate synthase
MDAKMADEGLAKRALAILQEKSEKALKNVKKLILREKFECERVNEALRYYISTWNDTTRPGVLALAHEAVGGELEEVVPLQTAMLLIDAAMDIHDDIIDKSKIKGSKETLFGRFGKEVALLIGNTFLVEGFSNLYNALEELSLKKRQLLLGTVKNFLFEVINAHLQEVELRNRKWNMKPEEYINVLKMKAADIEGHIRVGAIFGGASTQEIRALAGYGRYLGILLLIRSDFVDMFEQDELMNRVKHECLPLPVLFAIQNTTFRSKVYAILLKKEIRENNINELIGIIYEMPEIINIRRYLKSLEKKAISLLVKSKIKNEDAKNKLILLAKSMLEDL